MEWVIPAAILLAAAVCNCGFWLFCFNRINASGAPRRWTKVCEKIPVGLCFAIPAWIAYQEFDALHDWLARGTSQWPTSAPWIRIWLTSSFSAGLVLGPSWLESRRWLLPPPLLLRFTTRNVELRTDVPDGSVGDRCTHWLARLPGNQITQLDITSKELLLPRPILHAEGLKIGHLSDLHFTGQLTLAHFQAVVDELLALQPDLIVVTGDIIDRRRCLDWIEPILDRLRAPLGCAFVLGNHDLRIGGVEELTARIRALGHLDAGNSDHLLTRDDGLQLMLTGNEQPWLERHRTGTRDFNSLEVEQSTEVLRIGLSHSPDQIEWARRQRLDLLLAGHTHGGQIRLPLIGPLVSPSIYGSRFASGVFYLPPTLMHVSRGISGTQPLRWRCAPEVSLLILRSAAEVSCGGQTGISRHRFSAGPSAIGSPAHAEPV